MILGGLCNCMQDTYHANNMYIYIVACNGLHVSQFVKRGPTLENLNMSGHRQLEMAYIGTPTA